MKTLLAFFLLFSSASLFADSDLLTFSARCSCMGKSGKRFANRDSNGKLISWGGCLTKDVEIQGDRSQIFIDKDSYICGPVKINYANSEKIYIEACQLSGNLEIDGNFNCVLSSIINSENNPPSILIENSEMNKVKILPKDNLQGTMSFINTKVEDSLFSKINSYQGSPSQKLPLKKIVESQDYNYFNDLKNAFHGTMHLIKHQFGPTHSRKSHRIQFGKELGDKSTPVEAPSDSNGRARMLDIRVSSSITTLKREICKPNLYYSMSYTYLCDSSSCQEEVYSESFDRIVDLSEVDKITYEKRRNTRGPGTFYEYYLSMELPKLLPVNRTYIEDKGVQKRTIPNAATKVFRIFVKNEQNKNDVASYLFQVINICKEMKRIRPDLF